MAFLIPFVPPCVYLYSSRPRNFFSAVPETSPFDRLSEKDKDLVLTVTELIKEIGIKKIITAFDIPGGRFFGAGGNAFYKPRVSISFHFFYQNPLAAKYILRHELAHIKNLDSLTRPAVVIIAGLATAVFATYFAMAWFFALPLVILVMVVSFSLFSQYCERKADAWANAKSSVEELQ
jgi:beta-lactamase regulating signal transducer with metallopeptidase domain